MRPHGINQYSFLVYLLGLHSRVTVTLGTSLPYANLSAYYALVPSFCPSGYDFAIPSSRLHLTMQTLGVAFGLVGNYLPADFHRRALVCPSYVKLASEKLRDFSEAFSLLTAKQNLTPDILAQISLTRF